jgi:hypothetical protein
MDMHMAVRLSAVIVIVWGMRSSSVVSQKKRGKDRRGLDRFLALVLRGSNTRQMTSGPSIVNE